MHQMNIDRLICLLIFSKWHDIFPDITISVYHFVEQSPISDFLDGKGVPGDLGFLLVHTNWLLPFQAYMFHFVWLPLY